MHSGMLLPVCTRAPRRQKGKSNQQHFDDHVGDDTVACLMFSACPFVNYRMCVWTGGNSNVEEEAHARSHNEPLHHTRALKCFPRQSLTLIQLSLR